MTDNQYHSAPARHISGVEARRMRGISKCIQVSSDLFIDHLRLILSRTWQPALAVGLLTTLYVMTRLLWADGFTAATRLTVPSWSMALLLPVLGATAWLYGCAVSLLSGEPRRACIGRAVRLTLLMAGVGLLTWVGSMAVAALVLYAMQLRDGLTGLLIGAAVAGLTELVMLLLLLPTLYSGMRYLSRPGLKVGSVLGRPYRDGWRHWAFLFALVLVVVFMTAILFLLLMIPMTLTLSAYAASAQGVQMGDASGLPAYMPWLTAGVTCLCVTVWQWVGVWTFFVMYHAYGSIEATREAKGLVRTTEIRREA